LTTLDISGLRISGDYLFENCTSLKEVITSDDTAIGSYMFYGCTSLTSFVFKGNRLYDGAFMNCTSLADFTFTTTELFYLGKSALANTAIASITLPNGTYTLSAGAFGGCSSLESVTLSDNTKLTGNGISAFTGCNKFTKYIVSASNANYTTDNGILYDNTKTSYKTTVVAVPYGYTADTLTLPSTVTTIGEGAFAGLSKLYQLDLNNVTNIGAYAFAESGLNSVTLPAGLTVLAEGAFYGCSALSSVNAENLTTIGDSAFYGCSALKTIDLSSATTIGANAFKQSGLTSVTATAAIEIGASAFERSKLVKVELPKAQILGDSAFAYVTTLEEAKIGPSRRTALARRSKR
jgi:hypothetical protein